MRKKAALLTFVGLVAVFALAVDDTLARNREARPGQPRREFSGSTAKAGGPDCANATAITPDMDDMLMFGDTDTTCGETNKVDNYNNFGTGGACNTVDYPGPDLIYTYTMTGPTNDISAALTPTAPADMGVFVLSDCPNGLSCVGFEDQIGGGATSEVVLTNQPVGTYYIYVDSYYPSGPESCGNYNINVTGMVPVKLMDFKVE